MANKTTQSANDAINYYTRNVAPSWGGATTLYASLHTTVIGLGGNATTAEIAYTGYARMALIRDPVTGIFNAAVGGSTSNNAIIQWGNATAGAFPIAALAVGISAAPSGPATIIATGTLANSGIVINLNSAPQFPIGALVWAEQ
jgi:hypothetical protein